ncbi:hypothetical protein [Lachnoclostridium sp.]|nr:hypothetical protein [Lachnoclostridium sp.]
MSEAVLEAYRMVKSNGIQSQKKSEDLTKMVLKLQEVLDFF